MFYFFIHTGCDDLNLSSDNRSKITCKQSGKYVICNVVCKVGHIAMFPKFLSLQCYKENWIRKNDDDGYVRLSSLDFHPRCHGMCLGFALGEMVGCVSSF